MAVPGFYDPVRVLTKNAHAGDEVFIERRVSSIATLDAGFDERVGAPGERNDVYGDNDKKKSDK